MKRACAVLLCLTALLCLSGCGSMFPKEYVVVGDYTPVIPADDAEEGRVTVSDLPQLRRALLEMVSAGEQESSIIFDADYEGEISEDMASACWQVRTQDALCAYCVENISYDLTKIVNHTEAKMTVRYSDAVCSPTDVQRRTYSSGMDELIREMLTKGSTREAVLINQSYYSSEGMEELIADVYRTDPILSPQAPSISVMMLSGSGTQRLYEIDLDYGMNEQERQRRLEALQALEPFAGMELEAADEAHRALAAAEWLSAHCRYAPDGNGDLYSALIEGAANDEGMAYAYVYLCRLLNLDCRMVYGQKNWEDGCWNIISAEGSYYHVDPTVCAAGDYNGGFLLRDEVMWENCRWDVSAYPACTGELSWYTLAVQDGLIEPPPDESGGEIPAEESAQEAVVEIEEESEAETAEES